MFGKKKYVVQSKNSKRNKLFVFVPLAAVAISLVAFSGHHAPPPAKQPDTFKVNDPVPLEDAALPIYQYGNDIIAPKDQFQKIWGDNVPSGFDVAGGYIDLTKAGNAAMLSDNYMLVAINGKKKTIRVTGNVQPSTQDNGQAQGNSGQAQGNAVQTGNNSGPIDHSDPNWWLKGFFAPKPTDVPYLLTDADLLNVPAIPPEAIQYKQIKNPGAVIAWLNAKNSMEAGQKYLDIVDAAGKKYSINPLLLLAITGQEQSFVPKDSPYASQIIKNPWNVYGSWQDYAPGYEKAALIAAQTVNRLSADCPAGMNPLHWIDSPQNPRNRYAEDTNWWKGVSIFFDQLMRVGD